MASVAIKIMRGLWQIGKCSAWLSLMILLGLSQQSCGRLISAASADLAASLSTAILEQDDPGLVRDGVPAYLLLLDSFVERSPEDAAILGAASQLYAVYGSAFVADDDRARRLTRKARAYGRRSLCAADQNGCDLAGQDFASYEASIAAVDAKAVDALYSYAVSNLAYIRAHSGDLGALAGLPKAETALKHVLDLGPGERLADTYKFLGILNTLRPPALGGNPELGRNFFEQALSASKGKDLTVKLEYARSYARLVYERELHDRLLNEVLSADIDQPGLTLFNSMAQAEAKKLLASADDYF